MDDIEKDRRINELADQFEELWNGGQRIGADEFLARLADEETTWQELREEIRVVEQELRKKYLKTSVPGKPIQRIGNYELLEQIGRGGMGDVYRARQVFLDRIDAVKVVQDKISEIPEAVERFERELKLIGNLSHQNIVRAYGAEQTDDGKLLLAMEFVEGTSLQQLIDSGQIMPVEEAIVIIRQVAAGLQYAHERKIVHRDIKPANIMLTADSVAKILDFGLGKFYSECSDSSGTLTRMGTPFGTLDYTSPEQSRDPGGVDIRTDIYALGCTFYTIVTGEVPYPSSKFGSMPAKILAHIDQPPPSFLASSVEVSPGVEAILQKMCAKKHDQRFATPQELIDAIDEYLPANIILEKRPFPWRQAVAGILIVCIAFLLGGWLLVYQQRVPPLPEQEVLEFRYFRGDPDGARNLCRKWIKRAESSWLPPVLQPSLPLQKARAHELLADCTLYGGNWNDYDHVEEAADSYLQAIAFINSTEKKSILNGKRAILAMINGENIADTDGNVGKGSLFFAVANGIGHFDSGEINPRQLESLYRAIDMLHVNSRSIVPQSNDPWELELFDLQLLCIRQLLPLISEYQNDEAKQQDVTAYVDLVLLGTIASRRDLHLYLRKEFEKAVYYYQKDWRKRARYIHYMRGNILSEGSARLIFHFTDEWGSCAIFLSGDLRTQEGFPLPWTREELQHSRDEHARTPEKCPLYEKLVKHKLHEKWGNLLDHIREEERKTGHKVALSWSDAMYFPLGEGLSREDWQFEDWSPESQLKWEDFYPAK